MGIRKEGLAAVERIVKRRLARYNLDLLKPQRMNPKIEAHGGYKVRDAATGKTVREHSRVVMVLYLPSPEAEAAIEAIRAAYKTRFRQDSVLRLDETDCVAF